jgi:tRNA(Ile)-lysidine synthase
MGPRAEVAAVRLAVRRVLAELEPGDLTLVACSGGADSIALAAALAYEAPRLALRAGAVTVDHGLQSGSPERARAVAAVLAGLGLDPVEVLPVEVGGVGGPEAAARAARYAAIAEAAARLGAGTVLLAHTLDDQAETVLLGLARGSGGRSLAGMPAAAGRYRRPLLALGRSTVRAAAQGIAVWEDPQNEDPAFARSRVRHRALPALEDSIGPGVAAALARTADLLRHDADALDAWAERAEADVVGADGSLDAAGLLALPVAVRTRVLRRAALAAGSAATDLAGAHIAAVDRLLTEWHGQGPLELPGRVSARRECGRLLLSRDGARDPGPRAG